MADIHDYMGAAKDADAALSSLEIYAGQVELREKTGDPVLCMALVGIALATAIRTIEVRLDYVLREVTRNYG